MFPIIELSRAEKLDVSPVVLVEVGHAVVKVDRALEFLGEGEGGGAASGSKSAIGKVVIPEMYILGADSSDDEGDS